MIFILCNNAYTLPIYPQPSEIHTTQIETDDQKEKGECSYNLVRLPNVIPYSVTFTFPSIKWYVFIWKHTINKIKCYPFCNFFVKPDLSGHSFCFDLHLVFCSWLCQARLHCAVLLSSPGETSGESQDNSGCISPRLWLPSTLQSTSTVCSGKINSSIFPIAYNFDRCPSTRAVIQDLFSLIHEVEAVSGLAFSSALCGQNDPPTPVGQTCVEMSLHWSVSSLIWEFILTLVDATVSPFFSLANSDHIVNPEVTTKQK